MNWHVLTGIKAVRSAIGAALAVLCGLLLWEASSDVPLINYSYDALWLFGGRSITNKVTFIMMDNESYAALHQKRGGMWDRRLHAQLLDKLAVDNCAVVVLDIFLGKTGNSRNDLDLARAIRRHHEIALRAGFIAQTNSSEIQPLFPSRLFLNAAGNRWGISRVNPDPDAVVRRHWPFPSPGKFPTLAETAARTAGAVLAGRPRERWIRYYGGQLQWQRLSYTEALKEPANFFHEQVVFLGIKPKSLALDDQRHKYRTPYSRWTREPTVATDMLITEFLNLYNHDYLRRSAQLEVFTLLVAGLVVGALLAQLRFGRALVGAAGVTIIVVSAAVALTALTNYWFPWLLIVVGQMPVALVWSLANVRANRLDAVKAKNRMSRTERPPEVDGYRVIEPAFGRGAYGTVWLARNKKGEWRAVKVVSQDKFGDDRGPYDREYEGVSRYREISNKHPGLLRVEFVSEKSPTHFYYIMELGDGLDAGWEKTPIAYKPRDLNNVRALAPHKRLPIAECLRIGIALSDTLDFLHRSGFTHRDIKPQNILFVNGQPKFADVGLVTHIRESDQERTAVGTPGYMPPAPEMPGTSEADIFALGMVLYVISTGRSPTLFPELSETLLGGGNATEFFLLNSVVLKACQPDPKERYPSAREMCAELEMMRAKLSRASL